ncbi:hypothetical protein BDA99DRAFT_566289 [Phascolomyces articulosus]|uniref:BLOC-1-related complex subunit 6 C-terminal helix domain-containing protein n=1 Tax=Phascolomyces articulosus TaxID=60185 RepID=A0AAD5JLC5_9FUNG|nr:hypothetical protein BDA99DRAFT_566289 [Phascolomyces articulosus]
MNDSSSSSSLPLDVELFQSLETRATELSKSMAEMVHRLQVEMKQMSASTTESCNVYKESVQRLSDQVDACTEKTVQLITECDELDKDLAQLHSMAKQIKTIDKALDRLNQSI